MGSNRPRVVKKNMVDDVVEPTEKTDKRGKIRNLPRDEGLRM